MQIEKTMKSIKLKIEIDDLYESKRIIRVERTTNLNDADVPYVNFINAVSGNAEKYLPLVITVDEFKQLVDELKEFADNL